LITGGFWSAYWYNGHIYATEIARGLDVFRLTPSEHLSENELEAARLVHSAEFNAQHQRRIAWPAQTVVALAYLDQLARTKGILPARAQAVKTALERADTVRNGDANGAAAVKASITGLAAQIERDAAAAAVPGDAARLRSLAATMQERIASVR
jgi:hypothetical protein